MAVDPKVLSVPVVRQALDTIAYAEGTYGRGNNGYDVAFGYQPFDPAKGHPRIKKQFTQTDGKVNYTTAAGRYQIIEPTFDGLSAKLGRAAFDPETQDLMALELLNGIPGSAKGRTALDDILAGDVKGGLSRAGGIWASLPSSTYPQGKRSQSSIDNFIANWKPSGGPVPAGSFQTPSPEIVVSASTPREKAMLNYIETQPDNRKQSLYNLLAFASAPVDSTDQAFLVPQILRDIITGKIDARQKRGNVDGA